jgi:hypothetical protein
VNDPSEPCEQSSCYARTIAIIALSLNIGRTCVGREDTSLIGFDLFSSPHNFHHFFVDSFTSTSHKSLLVHDVSVRMLEGGVLVVCHYIASQFDADSAFTVSAVPTTPSNDPFSSTQPFIDVRLL